MLTDEWHRPVSRAGVEPRPTRAGQALPLSCTPAPKRSDGMDKLVLGGGASGKKPAEQRSPRGTAGGGGGGCGEGEVLFSSINSQDLLSPNSCPSKAEARPESAASVSLSYQVLTAVPWTEAVPVWLSLSPSPGGPRARSGLPLKANS